VVEMAGIEPASSYPILSAVYDYIRPVVLSLYPGRPSKGRVHLL